MTTPRPAGAWHRTARAAGLTASGRAGRLRIAFHLWNDESDVTDVVAALGGVGPTTSGR